MNLKVKKLLSELPSPHHELIDGVIWGRCDQLFTPAYWKVQYHLHEDEFCNDFYRISDNIIEEICACILGGHGMKSEIGLIAFERLRDLDLLIPEVDYKHLVTALSIPFWYQGRFIKYRFPIIRSKYIYELLKRSDLHSIPKENDLDLRKWLLTVKGIGMKTASWITRNWLCSEKVAILDVHIYRAGLIAGFFTKNLSIEKDYEVLEGKYLAFTNALNVSAANLDSLMWLQLKIANHIAIDILKIKN